MRKSTFGQDMSCSNSKNAFLKTRQEHNCHLLKLIWWGMFQQYKNGDVLATFDNVLFGAQVSFYLLFMHIHYIYSVTASTVTNCHATKWDHTCLEWLTYMWFLKHTFYFNKWACACTAFVLFFLRALVKLCVSYWTKWSECECYTTLSIHIVNRRTCNFFFFRYITTKS